MGQCAVMSCCPNICVWSSKYDYAAFEDEKEPDSASCWPCAPHALYIKSPSSRSSLEKDARVLYKAMKGLGTREEDLIRILANRTESQLRIIGDIFEQEYGNGNSLEKWIADESTGDFEKVMLTCLKNPAVRDAEIIHTALSRPGTWDEWLQDIMVTRTPRQMEDIAKVYEQKYGKTLKTHIKSDTSLNYEALLLALTNRTEHLARRVHDAITCAGTDDQRVIRILSSCSRSNRRLRSVVHSYDDCFRQGWKQELELELDFPDMQDLKETYQRLYGSSLEQAITKDTSGNYERLCLTLMQTPGETTADMLHRALGGSGTDDSMLIEIMTGRSNKELLEACAVYATRYNKTLHEAIRADTSGDYQKMLLSLLTPRPEKLAESVHQSFSGVGTDDKRLMAAVTGKSKREVKEMVGAFERIYEKKMTQATASETSLSYKRTLKYIMRQSNEDLMYLNKRHLLRVQDMANF